MIPVIRSDLLARASGVRHAFFTRRGGVSQGLYTSLNAGAGSRDRPDHVSENRRRTAERLGGSGERLVTAYQVHSADVLLARSPWPDERPKGDGLVTDELDLICGVLTADCAPVLMVDATARVAAAAHAGWRGALDGVIAATVARMVALGAQPDRIVAAIGPCIGPRSYEVGEEFLDRFARAAPDSAIFFSAAATPDKRLFDLPGFVLSRLRLAGVTQAEWVGRDTFAEEDAFFSNRRAVHRGEDDYGRLLSAIVLED